MAEPEDSAERLYGLPREEFVAARDARAKELRAGGDREAAEAVGKLPKPTVAAWAVNQLAHRHAGEMDQLLRAGEELHAAHERLLEGDRGDMAEAAAAERDAVGRLAERAGALEGVSGPTLEKVVETLRAAAGSEELRDRLRRGTVAREQQAAMFGGLAAGAASPRPSRRPAAKRRARTDGEDAKRARQEERVRREREEKERRELAERLKAARAELRRLRGEHGRSRRALEAAERSEARAQEQLDERTRKTEAARDHEDRARREMEEAEREVERLEG